MALLTDADRKVSAREFIRKVFEEQGQIANFDTLAIKAAIDATDAWIDGNQVAYNAALPEPFKSMATLSQKTLLFCYVAMKRAGLI